MIKYEFIGKCLLISEAGERVLVIGDLHMGYEEVLNLSGILVSREMYGQMIGELEAVFKRVGKVDRVVLLGDIKHDFSGVLKQEWNDVLGLFDFVIKHCGEIVVIRGNHDNYLLNITSKRSFVRVVDFLVLGEFCFMHGHKDFPEAWGEGIKVWVIGHNHPAVRLREGVKSESYKCFLKGDYKGREIIIIPSFFNYSMGMDMTVNELKLAWEMDKEKLDVYIVGENLEVLNFGKLKDLK